jgi:hypothetical protein
MTTNSEWHDASDKPKSGRGVLVWCPGNKCYYMAYWQDGKWRSWNIGATERENIAAWREVPRNPEFS